ncbi:type VI secretion system-associated FHA domain protein TagH [Rhodobacteraceae bacterium]|nr:type VI secretion system-associated FHA domain protein TagH [Paracoccaceae bacterium]
MSGFRLILEHAPTSQAVTEMAFHGGQMSVGRGEEADWRIHDPEHFVSRKHFFVSTEAGDIMLTDSSSGGLFVDGATEPLGAGNSVRVEDGMRVRFGDFVARVELENTAAHSKPKDADKPASPFDFDFEPAGEPTPKAERPDTLPEPFGKSSSPFFSEAVEEKEQPPEPIDRENPFALGLKPTASDAPKDAAQNFGGYFGSPEPEARPEPVPDAEPVSVQDVAEELQSQRVTRETTVARPSKSEDELRAAFFRGLGLDAGDIASDDPVAEMEAMGKRFRALADGVTHLLRTRAAEKQKVRIAQTIVGSSNVNPLKFAVSADDAVSSLVAARGSGYLDPDASIDEAFRDLVDHQMRTWAALQTALRRMIDKFEPDAIEKELEDAGVLETLIAGGRSAKLWQLYQERYEEIARAAEERFLGEVGSEFRDAYER